jgi:hypothetical protein
MPNAAVVVYSVSLWREAGVSQAAEKLEAEGGGGFIPRVKPVKSSRASAPGSLSSYQDASREEEKPCSIHDRSRGLKAPAPSCRNGLLSNPKCEQSQIVTARRRSLPVRSFHQV